MTDVVDKATRSRMMAGIRGKNTKPEMIVRKALHARGFRFRLHDKKIPGKPDIILPKYNSLIIINGCFWHGHTCKYFKLPKNNTDFWLKKINSNQSRDTLITKKQLNAGWRCLIIWECAIRAIKHQEIVQNNLAEIIVCWLKSHSAYATITTDENNQIIVINHDI